MDDHNIIYSTNNSYFEEKDGKSNFKSINIDQNIRLHLDRKKGGVDAEFSLEPEEFKNYVKNIRFAEETLGHKYGMNLIKPERYKPFIMLCIFRILLKFRIMKGEELGVMN